MRATTRTSITPISSSRRCGGFGSAGADALRGDDRDRGRDPTRPLTVRSPPCERCEARVVMCCAHRMINVRCAKTVYRERAPARMFA
jgi:hypothetical protein